MGCCTGVIQQRSVELAREPSPSFIVITIVIGAIALFVTGLILSIGYSNKSEVIINYTDCRHDESDELCADFVKNSSNFLNFATCPCTVFFKVEEEMTDPYIFYKITNFFQNQRFYLRSKSYSQLTGKNVKDTTSCEPLTTAEDPLTNETLPILPCGLVANSMFNDSFKVGNSTIPELAIHSVGVNEPLKSLFANPSSNLQTAFAGTIKPPNWPKPIHELDVNNPDNNGFLNEKLIFWMTTSAFKDFRKLYGRLSTISPGQYRVSINYAYPVTAFDGEKFMIISQSRDTSSDKFNQQGQSLIIIGAVLFVMSCILFIIIQYTKRLKKIITVEQTKTLKTL